MMEDVFMGEKSNVDTGVMDKLKEAGYAASEFNYMYSIPSEGNEDIKPEKGKKFLSKNLKESRMELEFCIFSQSKRKADKNRAIGQNVLIKTVFNPDK